MMARRFMVMALGALLHELGCGGIAYQPTPVCSSQDFQLYGCPIVDPPDKPTPPDQLACRGTVRSFDSDKDGRADRFVAFDDRRATCFGDDANKDGRVDSWTHYSASGAVDDMVVDTDRDGVFDERRQDKDGDGKLETTTRIKQKA
jgi:hypothetical protein